MISAIVFFECDKCRSKAFGPRRDARMRDGAVVIDDASVPDGWEPTAGKSPSLTCSTCLSGSRPYVAPHRMWPHPVNVVMQAAKGTQ